MLFQHLWSQISSDHQTFLGSARKISLFSTISCFFFFLINQLDLNTQNRVRAWYLYINVNNSTYKATRAPFACRRPPIWLFHAATFSFPSLKDSINKRALFYPGERAFNSPEPSGSVYFSIPFGSDSLTPAINRGGRAVRLISATRIIGLIYSVEVDYRETERDRLARNYQEFY